MVEIGVKNVGPWIGTLSREAMVDPKNGNTTYSLRLDAGADRQANIKRATLSFGNSPAATGRAEFFGQAHAMLAVVPTPSEPASVTTVTLAIEEWSGARHVAEFPDALDRRPVSDATAGSSGSVGSGGLVSPPAPVAFYVIVAGFAVTVGMVISAWLWAMTRPPRLPS